MKQRLVNRIKISTIASAVALFSVFIVFSGQTYAVTDTSLYSVTIDSSLSLTVSDTVTFSGSVDTLAVSSLTATAHTNNQTGITMTMTTNKDSDQSNATNLKHTAVTDTIPTLTSSVAKSSFPTNYWGYSLDDSTYAPLLAKDAATPIQILQTSSNSQSKSQTVYFGVKVDESKSSGTYLNEVLITVTPNYVPVTLATISTMQEMNYQVCVDTTTPSASAGSSTPQYKLIDERDEKVYYVAKLADGKCWMTQNLDFDIPANSLSWDDTDMSSSWTTSSTYPIVATSTDMTNFSTSATAVQSWDPGDYYYDGVLSTSFLTGLTSFNNVSGFTTSGDAHYHVGNYYSWNAATAGTGATTSSGDATSSICPSNWRLPTASSTYDDFNTLITTYSAGSNTQTLVNAPIYLTRTGDIAPEDPIWFYGAGVMGVYTTSTVYDSHRAYVLYFTEYDSDVRMDSKYDDADSERYVSKPIRCVSYGEQFRLYFNYVSVNASNMPSMQTADNIYTSTYTFTIPSTVPTASGYTFAGWRNPDDDTIYQPGDTITVNSISTHLYTEWE